MTISSVLHEELPTSAPHPPFIEVPGIFNFRTISLPTTSEGGHGVKSNVLYRSGLPSPEAVAAQSTLLHDKLHIRAVFDLRSDQERSKSLRGAPVEPTAIGDAWSAIGIMPFHVPVFSAGNNDPAALAVRFKWYGEKGTEGFTNAYREILTHGVSAFRTILQYLAAAERQSTDAILVHCSAGKDRTGVFFAILLSLLGCTDADIAKEYHLTELGFPREVAEAFIAALLKSPALEGDEDKVRNVVSAREENMASFLTLLRLEYGGAEQFVKEQCGISPAEIDRLRERLLTAPTLRSDLETVTEVA